MRQHYTPTCPRNRNLAQAIFTVAALLALTGLLAWGLEIDTRAQADDAALQAALRPADLLPPAERRAYAEGVRAAFLAARHTRDGQALAAACQAAQR